MLRYLNEVGEDHAAGNANGWFWIGRRNCNISPRFVSQNRQWNPRIWLHADQGFIMSCQ
jgi:hypothetical protein